MVKSKKVKTVKKHRSKLNVIFDIDDTLIHSYNDYPDQRLRTNGIAENTEYGLFKSKNGAPFIYFIRNYTPLLLNYCLENFNVGIWSVGGYNYIIPLLKELLTENQYKKLNLIISSKKRNDKYVEYYDDKNKQTFKIDMLNDKPIKPLEYLFDNYKNFNAKNTILIDDSSFNISVNPLNSIYVPKYCLKESDNYLFKVYQWLDKHGKKKDIRYIDKKLFKYDEKINNNCFTVSKYQVSKSKLNIGDFVEYKKEDLFIFGYIININKNKYDIVEFDEDLLYKNDFKFTKYNNLYKSSLRKLII